MLLLPWRNYRGWPALLLPVRPLVVMAFWCKCQQRLICKDFLATYRPPQKTWVAEFYYTLMLSKHWIVLIGIISGWSWPNSDSVHSLYHGSASFIVHKCIYQSSGCPLSPLLFVLAIEPLASLIIVNILIMAFQYGDIYEKNHVVCNWTKSALLLLDVDATQPCIPYLSHLSYTYYRYILILGDICNFLYPRLWLTKQLPPAKQILI